jgi:hypothetical protein
MLRRGVIDVCAPKTTFVFFLSERERSKEILPKSQHARWFPNAIADDFGEIQGYCLLRNQNTHHRLPAAHPLAISDARAQWKKLLESGLLRNVS